MHFIRPDAVEFKNMDDGTLDLEKELVWIEGKYNEAKSNIYETYRINQTSKDDDHSNHTICDIEQFIDDSYLEMMVKWNKQKDMEIVSLQKELFHAYEVQYQMSCNMRCNIVESAGLRFQLEKLKRCTTYLQPQIFCRNFTLGKKKVLKK